MGKFISLLFLASATFAQTALLQNGWITGLAVPTQCTPGVSPIFYHAVTQQLYDCNISNQYALRTTNGPSCDRATCTYNGVFNIVNGITSPHTTVVPNNTVSPVITVPMTGSLEHTGGWLQYTIEVTNGTDTQYYSSALVWAAVKKGAVFNVDTHGTTGMISNVASAGSLIVSWSIASVGGNSVELRVNVNSSLAGTTNTIKYVVHHPEDSTNPIVYH